MKNCQGYISTVRLKNIQKKIKKCFIKKAKSILNEHCLNGNLLTLIVPIAGKNVVGTGETIGLLDLNNKLEFT